MLVFAVVLALVSFFLLVLTIQTDNIVWAYALVVSSLVGIGLWGIDSLTRLKNRRAKDASSPREER